MQGMFRGNLYSQVAELEVTLAMLFTMSTHHREGVGGVV